MPVKARLKFRGEIPWDLEHRLIAKYGFRVQQRNGREWFIVDKHKSNFEPEVLVNGELPEAIQNELIKRCNTICDQFNDPERHLDVIRIRLQNICLTLPPLQRKFVKEWTDRNLVEDQ